MRPEKQSFTFAKSPDPISIAPTRETATGGASRAVLEYGWSSPQDRTIIYQLQNSSGQVLSSFYVVQNESNPDRASGSPFGPTTSYDQSAGYFLDGLMAPTIFNPQQNPNSIQTFFISPVSQTKSAANMMPVLVRDSGGNDYSKLGVWMSSNQIFVNGNLAPSMAPCK